MIRAGADFSGMRKEMVRANQNLADFKAGITRTMKGIAVTLAGLGIGGVIKSAVKDAMTFEASMQQVDRQMGASSASFKAWARDNAAAFGMSKLQAVQYGAVYGNLISGFSSGTEQTMQRTRDLLKASAIVASATGRDMQDVMERIRSGLLGETDAIEDLGINVNIAMIQSTKAFRQFAGDRSWQQLDFNTQQQIRLMAIMEQATAKYGNSLQANTFSKQAQFVAQLRNTRLALGQAFLPIYNAVLPALIRMATALATAANYVAQFFQALFGGGKSKQQTQQTVAQSNAVTGLGDAYKDAGKKAKGALASFDQINQVGGDKGDGSAGDAGGTAGSTGSAGDISGVSSAMDNISTRVQQIAAKVREMFVPISEYFKGLKRDFDAFYNDISPALADIAAKLGKLKGPALDLAIESLKVLADTIKGTLGNALTILAGDIKVLDDLLNGNFKKALNDTWTALTRIDWKSMYDWIRMLTNPLGTLISKFGEAIAKWTGFDDIAKKFGSSLKGVSWSSFLAGLQSLTNPFGTLVNKIIDGIAQTDIFKNGLAGLKTNVLIPLGKFISSTFNINLSSIGEMMANVKTRTIEAWNSIKSSVSTAYAAISKLDFAGIKSGIVNVWNDLKTQTSAVWSSITSGIKGDINFVIDAINKFIAKVNGIKINIPKVDLPFGGSIGGGSISMPNVPPIPRLAKGGLAYGPTLAMVGDNRGAAADPEVISPLSKLQSMIESSQDNAQIVGLLGNILQAVKENKTVQAVIGRDAVGQAATGYINDQFRRGKNPLPAL